MSGNSPDGEGPDVPEWDDRFLDPVAERLRFNYDLEKDRRVRGRTFDLYGQMRMESHKQFFLPSLDYANHQRMEHLFVRRAESVARGDLESLVELGHDLADEWIEADEEHYGTDFTFVLVVPEIPTAVRDHVAGFSDRTLLKYGYYGSYEINLGVVAPDREAAVGSKNADVIAAFRLWDDPTEPDSEGLVGRLASLLGR
ncbi:hypothetical protein BRC82_09170 [Halobacteriales archaeon QS_1_67_19]|nr:MAG: hypothetical protein BRC82_09170 [Halobacteriales archaeon QS_1_67_19]